MSQSKTFYVIRHCKALGQEPNAPLSSDGAQAALTLAQQLKSYPIDRIISSPFLRAIDTIKPYAEQSGIPIETDARLAERTLTDQAMDDWMSALELSFDDLDRRWPGGETSREAMQRAQSLIAELAEQTGEQIVLVSHGNLISLLLKIYQPRIGFSEWQALKNPDIFRLTLHFASDAPLGRLHEFEHLR
jgi:2,3-bisphosphoglycerate-dependent phosphoglycerate mutase